MKHEETKSNGLTNSQYNALQKIKKNLKFKTTRRECETTLSKKKKEKEIAYQNYSAFVKNDRNSHYYSLTFLNGIKLK